MPCRSAHVMSATTTSCANRIRGIHSPRPSSAIPSTSGAIAPTYQSTCANPASRPRIFAGAVSVISVHDAGTSAPTVKPTMKYPNSSIHGACANTIQSAPNAYSSRSYW